MVCSLPAHAAYKRTWYPGSSQSLQPLPSALHGLISPAAFLYICTGYTPSQLLCSTPITCPLQDLQSCSLADTGDGSCALYRHLQGLPDKMQTSPRFEHCVHGHRTAIIKMNLEAVS